ncbi:hypothetical protein HYALB_00001027 [Hymenoscyphus albidus]|uniref:Uncharacterized protein n=1 Tax=Hymenoscyphus albidus TaxID=595503 RepID=A0A9N9M454_9HELO|nr:hypothetical protein HYALB_00001027 [Hymenoscyphus albidus]
MDQGPFQSIYKETRLDLESTAQGSTVAIRLPPHGLSLWPTRTAKRPHIVEIPVAEDEDLFKQRHLATEASVYHRANKAFPRSFLWRVLENGKVLSIRAVDFSKPATKEESHLTLRLHLPSPALPSCIALSDSEEHDSLSVFVLTESNHLYTLTLRPDFFRKPASTEGNVADWSKSYLCAAFSFKHPHRLVALTADELLISLIDGGLLKLNRKSGGDGSEWKEVFYNEGGWSNSFRSLIPFQGSNTVHYGKHNMELSAVTSIASPVINIRGMPYAFTVSLNHQLRVWNLITGKIAYMRDLLNEKLDPKEAVKKVIDPSLSQLVKVVYGTDRRALCVAYSPLEDGEFKFLRFQPVSEDGELKVDDIFPKNKLVPQRPTSAVWTLADFSVVFGDSANDFSLWTLWKNNLTYRVQQLTFSSAGNLEGSGNRTKDVNYSWDKDWKVMTTETLDETPKPTLFSGDASDITDKWLEYFFSPGRYSSATIETGLAIFDNNSGSTSRRSGSLPERMCSVLASNYNISRAADGSMDYESIWKATGEQWNKFYRLICELDKQRGEAQSLVIDPNGNLPWIMLADGITAVRECSDIERIWHNRELERIPKDLSTVATPILVAAEFRKSLSPSLLHSCKSMLLSEMFEEPSLTGPARVRAFYEKCDFPNQIADEDYNQVVDDLKLYGKREFKDITPQVYEAMYALMLGPVLANRNSGQAVSEFGRKLIIRGIQEIIELHRNIIIDQIILLVLIEVEVNHSENGIGFETAAVFLRFLNMLKKLELLDWLITTRISLPLGFDDAVASPGEKAKKQDGLRMETVPVVDAIMRHLFDLEPSGGYDMTVGLTAFIQQICSPLSSYETSPSLIQCYLLHQNRPDLAMDVNRFCDQDPFSTYIQGRAYLASGDPQAAALLFKKAAYGLSHSKTYFPSAGYLDEIERKDLSSGLPKYYSHIAAKYEKEKMYSYVIDFSRLSLQFLRHGSGDYEDKRLRTEMQSRLFTAALKTSRYELAHSALALLTNHPLQLASLRELITKMCENNCATELTELPLVGLHDEVDDFLASKCRKIVDVTVGVPYHKILYSWRIRRNDFRGAAAISLERLQRLQECGEGDKTLAQDDLETPVTTQYKLLINALSCVDPKQAWILYDQPQDRLSASKNGNTVEVKRRVIMLDEIRREYQAELDRIAAIGNNQFAFQGGDEMDIL